MCFLSLDGRKILFGKHQPHLASRPHDDRPETAALWAGENAPLAQAILEAILTRAYLQRSLPNGDGTIIIRLESWQIEVLRTFGVVIETERSSPNPVEAMVPLHRR